MCVYIYTSVARVIPRRDNTMVYTYVYIYILTAYIRIYIYMSGASVECSPPPPRVHPVVFLTKCSGYAGVVEGDLPPSIT